MFKPISPKVDFPAQERELLGKWYKNGIVDKYLHKNDNSKEKFSFLDGPITANNPMGVHHAWGRTYKDFWQRFWNMRGKHERFQNGFDEQGLWVEVEVEKELGLHNKKDIENLVPGDKFKSLEKFISLCKERVKKFSAIQTEQSKRLGYFMDWENSYHTSSDKNNYTIWHFLNVVNEKGWLYKGHDTVPWCPRCGTAISQHEILTEEYKEITHDTVYFKLPIKNKPNEFLLVWTTTPWTIPANVAVAVNAKEKYYGYNTGSEIIWMMDKRFEPLMESEILPTPISKGGKHQTKLGKELLGWEYEAPFDDLPLVQKALSGYTHRVIDGKDVVTETEGTGLLHVAPGAGEEDFKLGVENELPVIASIEEDASYVEGMGEFSGKNAKKHPELIINFLKQKDTGKFLLTTQRYKHRYPTCWRCKTELVWRLVDEWYIAMDRKDASGKTYREQMIEVAKKINWMPSWGLDRELDWLKNMHDWLISKKRYWGLALPIWECQKCKHFEVIDSKEELKKRTVEGWSEFEGHSPHRPWVDQVKIKCEKCGESISRIPDVGNPWLDAGIVPFSTMPEDFFPADFITESFPGQFKNWFYSLIAMSTALKGEPSFKNILGYALFRDEKGEEMHKSKGNAIEFNQAADKIGADVMRWLFLRINPEYNANFGYHVADDIRRYFHLRLWNVYSFFVLYANVDNWKPKKEKFTPTHMLDRWILSKMHGSIKNLTSAIERYNPADAAGSAEIFVINDLSTWYVRRIRDRVDPTALLNKDKEDAYQTLWTVLSTYAKVLAPFIPFIADDIYTNLTGETSVHLTDWPEEKPYIDLELEKNMQHARDLASILLMRRKTAGVKVRVPIKKLHYKGVELAPEILQLVKDEANVEELIYDGNVQGGNFMESGGPTEELTNSKNQNFEKGKARDIIRKIQDERKKIGTRLDEKVSVTLPEWPKEFEDFIKRNALVQNLYKGGEFVVERI